MKTISLMKNPGLHYAWGDYCAIYDFLGIPREQNRPFAELWMGAHPKACSSIFVHNKWIPLFEAIQSHPEEILGKTANRRFNGKLPYLFKILAAGAPLSIQAHPDAENARKGFARENEKKIAIDAPERNYKDPNPKPELLCALTPFTLLAGFRPPSEVLTYLEVRLKLGGMKGMGRELDHLRIPSENSIKNFFHSLMKLETGKKKSLLSCAVENAAKFADHDPVSSWIVHLNKLYPSDIAVLSPAYMNLVTLNPGDALFLDPGILHTYFEGMGVELMANSDNVLRCGLTPKHVAIQELMDAGQFRAFLPEIIRPLEEKESCNELVYPRQCEEFVLSVVRIQTKSPFVIQPENCEILLVTEGKITATQGDPDGDPRIELTKGDSVFIPKAAEKVTLTGKGRLFRVRPGI